MRLTQISATALHGRLAFHETIAPVTLILGDNGQGKSTLLGIPELVLAGPTGARFPVLGESPNYAWSAEVGFDTLPAGAARWMREGSHGASFRGVAGKLKDVQQRIDQAIGRAATWSLADFLGMTPAKRQAFLEAEVLAGAGWTTEATWERLAKEGVTRTDVVLASPEGT